MSNLLQSFIDVTGNPFAAIVEDGIQAGDVVSWIDTGSYALNALLSGDIFKGAPSNKVTALGAESSTGKSYIVLSVLKAWLEQRPTGIAFIFESESAYTKQMLEERGIDIKRVAIMPVTTIQEFRTQSLKILDNYEKTKVKDRVPLWFALDSLGNLSTTKELEDTSAGVETKDMTRAQLIKATFRVLTLRLGRADVPLWITNHVYDDVGGGPYAQKVMSGGSGLIYAASTIVTLSKARDKDEKLGAGTNLRGVTITARATKSRLTRENSMVKLYLDFNKGLGRYFYLAELAEAGGVFKKVATRLELPDGRKVFQSEINKNPEKYFTQEILEAINVYVNKTFPYGGGPEGEDGAEEIENAD